MYESEARKFLRDQGFVYSRTEKANLTLQAQKHCFSSPNTTQKTEQNIDPELQLQNQETMDDGWNYFSNSLANTIQYSSSEFTCLFNFPQPQVWSNNDISDIKEIVAAYSQQYFFDKHTKN